MIECPNHKGSFDCNPFCRICEGEQEFELSSYQDGVWEIAFCYDEFVIRTVAYGRTEQQAINQAESKIPNISQQVLEIKAIRD
jgi:hypothetical protein